MPRAPRGPRRACGPPLPGSGAWAGRRCCGVLFTEVEMSQPGMYARTLELARDRRLVVVELMPGYDVDTPQDLERLRSRAATSTELCEVRRWFGRYDARGASLTAVP